MNINAEILEYASSKDLTAIATGGGCDYIDRVVQAHADTDLASPSLVMASPFGDNSPHSMDDAAQVNVFPGDEWFSFIVVPFDSAKEAMDAMADSDFIGWAMYELGREIVEEDEQEIFKDAFVTFPGVDSKDPVAMAQAAEKVAAKWKLEDRDLVYHQHSEE